VNGRFHTSLLPGIAPHAHDDRVEAAITDLPSGARARLPYRAAITNEQLQIYREVDLGSELQVLHFKARMNALGFRTDRALRMRGNTRYQDVYRGR
jgi:hypothetical protein